MRRLLRYPLAWLLQKGGDVVPIPGTKRRKYLEENIAAADLRLVSGRNNSKLDQALAPEIISGPALQRSLMALVDR